MLYLSQAIGRPVLDAQRRADRQGRRPHRRRRRPLPAGHRARRRDRPAPDLPALVVVAAFDDAGARLSNDDHRHHQVPAAPERDPAARRPAGQADRRHRRPQGRARQRPPPRRRRGHSSTSSRSTSARPGLLRRLGHRGRRTGSLARNLRLPTPERYIDWEDVDPVETSIASIRLRVPHAGLAELHPADLATIIDQLAPRDRAGVLAAARRRGRRRRDRGDGARDPGRGPRGPRTRSAPPTSSRRCRPTTPPTSSPTCPTRRAQELLGADGARRGGRARRPARATPRTPPAGS